MKKLICLLVAAMLFLTGCVAVNLEESKTEEEATEPVQKELDLTANITITPVLYFLNESETRLQAESREIEVPQYSLREEYVLQALLDGPQTQDLSPLAMGLSLQRVEVMPELVNVYMGRDVYMRESDMENAKLAIAATIADFTGNKYVNILINNVQSGYHNTPTGVLQKVNNDLTEERMAMRGKEDTENPELRAALYYLDASENYLLPEIRRLVFKGQEYVPILVEQLIRGPEDTYNHHPSIDSKLELLSYEMLHENNQTILKLVFNSEPIVYTEGFTGLDGKRMALAALTYTLQSFVPNIDGIQVQVGESPATGNVYRMADFTELMGEDIQLYLPNSTTSTLLTGVDRIVPQDIASDPRSVLAELMKGPAQKPYRSDVYPAMPVGVTIDDVNSIYIAGNMMVVDFSEDVPARLEDISDTDEFIMIFSIVNTLTNFDGVSSVQFLVGGKRVDHLGGGSISIIDPIIRNPGIIRY